MARRSDRPLRIGRPGHAVADDGFVYLVAADPEEMARLERQRQGGTNGASAFGEQSCVFGLAENADGSTNRVAPGTVPGRTERKLPPFRSPRWANGSARNN